MTTKTSEKKQYESRHRWRWANSYPLKPGNDLRTRRAILSQIAEIAVSGEYWEAQGKLAARVGMTVRGLRKVLVKLCAEGALRAQRRGFKRTTVYYLLRLDEVAKHGGFLPAEETAQRFPRTGARDVERNGGSSYIGGTLEPVQPGKNRLEGNGGSSRHGLRGTGVPPKKRLREEEKEVRKPNGLLDAPANGAPRLPSAPNRTPSSFSSTEEDTHPDERPISPTARTLSDYVSGGTGRPLPGSWIYYPGLKRQVDRRDFLEVGSILAGILGRSGGVLPEPEKFFGAYGQYRQIHLAVESHRRNGRRRAAA